MSNQPMIPAASRVFFGWMVATLAAFGWTLSYASWRVALPLWLAGSLSALYPQRSVNAKEWVGILLASFGAPSAAFVVYRSLVPAP